MKKALFLLMIFSVLVLALSGCVAKNPTHDIVIAEVLDGLQEDYAEDAAMIKKIIIFESRLKVYMVDEYEPEKLGAFAKKITRLFGVSMRKNKILFQVWNMSMFQKKMYEDKFKLKEIANGTYENASDRVKIRELGLGEGKYDVYD